MLAAMGDVINLNRYRKAKEKAERAKLAATTCDACQAFFDAAPLPGDKENVCTHRRSAIQDVSRHRFRYVPPETQDGFWDLDFPSSPR